MTGYRKIDEIPFDFERRRLSVVVEAPDGAGRRLLITKGAPEPILALSTAFEAGHQVTPLDAAARQASAAVHERLSAEGFRVLAVAYRWLEPRDAYSRDDEADLVLAGFVSFADPVLPDVADVLAELKRDGVTVKILTGDNELVARHVCRSIGLDDRQIVTGDDIARTDDAALGHLAEQASVFTRVSPAQKNRIILALKRRGHVVGFMGDGINDAPSLHTADVGISVMTAADVARDAADVILGQPSLRVLHQGILEGRRASGQHDEVPADGHQLEFRQHVQHGGGVGLPAVPADAADADPAEQFPVRPGAGHDSERQRGRGLPPASPALGHARHSRLHAVHRPDQLDLRLPHRFTCCCATSTRAKRCFTPAGSSNRWRRRRSCSSSSARWATRSGAGPSRSLTVTTLAIVAIGATLPATPLAALLGFTRLPASYFAFLVPATITYLVVVDLAKRQLVRRLGAVVVTSTTRQPTVVAAGALPLRRRRRPRAGANRPGPTLTFRGARASFPH